MSRDPLIKIDKQTTDTAPGEAGQLLAQAEANLGFVPNMYGYMANHPGILSGYMQAYEQFRSNGGFTPSEQEVIFLSISSVNGCSYCMAAHSMLADKKSGVPADVLEALRAGKALPDRKLDTLARFTRSMVENRGAPSPEEVRAFLDAGYTEAQVLGIILAISAKTYSNYVNHLAATPVDDVFASYRVD